MAGVEAGLVGEPPDAGGEMSRVVPHRRSYDIPGHAHELTFTCYHRFRFLASDRTGGWLAEAIEQVRVELDFALWAFVFMPEHVHLIIWPWQVRYTVSSILKAIKAPVGRRAIQYLESHAPEWLPRITRHRGKRTERLFWQSGGGYDRNIDEPKTLVAMIEYLHHNPVRRGLVDRPSDWRWSSAGWYEGRNRCELIPDRLPPEWVPLE
jgi:putative transposase